MFEQSANLAAVFYTVSAVLFILALRGLSSPESSRRGNMFGMIGIAIAIATTVWVAGLGGKALLLAGGGLAVGGVIGAFIAKKIPMTDMPQLVAAFHSLVGLAAVLVAVAAFFSPDSFGIMTADGIKPFSLLELALGAGIGAITFSGSVIAFAKLNGNMSGAPIMLPARHLINIALAIAIAVVIGMLMKSGGADPMLLWILLGLTFVIGFLLIIPIGGADMPVVVSMLNSYSGWAAAALGFTLGNLALIVTGALVGSSGAILSYIMCKAMTVAGRMPGHMNVLLAEANVPYDEVFELEDINSEFANADVAFVIGANDVTNPAAKTDPQSPIFGMPILDVDKATTVLFVKRSLSPGYAGIDNDLFYEDKTMMLLSDAKKLVEEVIKSL